MTPSRPATCSASEGTQISTPEVREIKKSSQRTARSHTEPAQVVTREGKSTQEKSSGTFRRKPAQDSGRMRGPPTQLELAQSTPSFLSNKASSSLRGTPTHRSPSTHRAPTFHEPPGPPAAHNESSICAIHGERLAVSPLTMQGTLLARKRPTFSGASSVGDSGAKESTRKESTHHAPTFHEPPGPPATHNESSICAIHGERLAVSPLPMQGTLLARKRPTFSGASSVGDSGAKESTRKEGRGKDEEVVEHGGGEESEKTNGVEEVEEEMEEEMEMEVGEGEEGGEGAEGVGEEGEESGQSEEGEYDELYEDEDEEDDDDDEDEEDEEARYPVSRYIWDAAQESSQKRKRGAGKVRANVIVSDDSDNESKASKRRKNEPAQVKVPSRLNPIAKSKAKKKAASGAVHYPSNPLTKWSGPTEGPIKFYPPPSEPGLGGNPSWTFSSDGVNDQSPNHRVLGDIHFSPSLVPSEDCHYWVQVGAKAGGRWELYNPGRQHPIYAGYMLKDREGPIPPCWVRP
ncbi:hypothetical protein RSAG8_12546, partial [Rhizoctonia solani AG-8 WAC10335]